MTHKIIYNKNTAETWHTKGNEAQEMQDPYAMSSSIKYVNDK